MAARTFRYRLISSILRFTLYQYCHEAKLDESLYFEKCKK